MKKIFLGVLSIAIVAGTMSSCGKTNKGKISEVWNITATESVDVNTSSGTTTTYTNKETVSNGILSEVYSNGSTTNTKTGTVKEYTYTIKKDGTFETIADIT
ncbi:MAG TPA: hypothetical protein PLP27_09775 [Crocinitomicaceae bacterium]|nr:hypothetical protein [Crocinitomicaceae bacterium]